MSNTKITIGTPEIEEEPTEEVVLNDNNVIDLDDVNFGIEEEFGVEEEYGKLVEDLDPSEPIWEGGPTAGDIVGWKKQFGDVYVTSISMEQHVVWRTMNRLEYKNHVKNMEKLGQNNQIGQADIAMLNEELIAEMCILFPKFDRSQLVEEMAGIPSIIAQEVMEASGFVALEVRQL